MDTLGCNDTEGLFVGSTDRDGTGDVDGVLEGLGDGAGLSVG